ncbi:MAG: 8-oxo-dGTP diphosphatase MutT [Rhodospirillaceae bacterium]|nr:8-oxo-dGTP diphosphatase MutT [Rhodospirillaceae bacterium]
MTPRKPVVLVAAVALIDDRRRVLLAQRPAGKAMAGLWEFPGGKVEDHETPEQALVRELHEELGIDVAAADLEPLAFASHTYDDFHLLMPLFDCTRWAGRIVAKENQALAWVAAADLEHYNMPPADVPLIEPLRRALS